MTNEKRCPFKIQGYFSYTACDKEQCMMWRSYANDCAIGTIADILADSTICNSYFEQPAEEETK